MSTEPAAAHWNVTFGHGIFKNEEIKDLLLRYVPIRHDCVHRNGRSQEGVERREVDFQFVRNAANLFKGTALYLEGRREGVDFEDSILDEISCT